MSSPPLILPQNWGIIRSEANKRPPQFHETAPRWPFISQVSHESFPSLIKLIPQSHLLPPPWSVYSDSTLEAIASFCVNTHLSSPRSSELSTYAAGQASFSALLPGKNNKALVLNRHVHFSSFHKCTLWGETETEQWPHEWEERPAPGSSQSREGLQTISKPRQKHNHFTLWRLSRGATGQSAWGYFMQGVQNTCLSVEALEVPALYCPNCLSAGIWHANYPLRWW